MIIELALSMTAIVVGYGIVVLVDSIRDYRACREIMKDYE